MIMYYEEKVVDGVTYFRSSPDREWINKQNYTQFEKDYDAYKAEITNNQEKETMTEPGDLPPVGVECEACWENDDHPQWVKWTTLAISKLGVYVDFGDEKDWYYFSNPNHKLPSKFRPIQSDRDKAIEQMVGVIQRGGFTAITIAKALYEAGYRKTDDA
jgi:hypothetical protein